MYLELGGGGGGGGGGRGGGAACSLVPRPHSLGTRLELHGIHGKRSNTGSGNGLGMRLVPCRLIVQSYVQCK